MKVHMLIVTPNKEMGATVANCLMLCVCTTVRKITQAFKSSPNKTNTKLHESSLKQTRYKLIIVR